MSDRQSEPLPKDPATAELEARERRDFLLSLGKWSKAVIGGVLLGEALISGPEAQAQGGAGIWYNSGRGSGGWIQQPWGWYDRPRWYDGPRWYNGPYWRHRPYWRGPDWYDRPWYNGGGWYNGWYNR